MGTARNAPTVTLRFELKTDGFGCCALFRAENRKAKVVIKTVKAVPSLRLVLVLVMISRMATVMA